MAHCLIEGDLLDQAFPAPPGDPGRTELTRQNLRALWDNCSRLGYRRLIYTVSPPHTWWLISCPLPGHSRRGHRRYEPGIGPRPDTEALQPIDR